MTTQAIKADNGAPVRYGRAVARIAAGVLASGTVALVVALVIGGGAAPQPLQDPGAVVRWGLPVVKLVFSLSAAVTIGALLFRITVLSENSPARDRASRLALMASFGWTISSGLSLVLAFMSLVPVRRLDALVVAQFVHFATAIPLGQIWLANTVVTSLIVIFVLFLGRASSAIPVLGLAFAAVLALAATGHAAGSPNHSAAVTALALHISGAATWVGGLVLLAVVGPVLGPQATVAVRRFSSVALLCFIIVASSGVLAAFFNLGSIANLASAYGGILIAKAVALVFLGTAGAWNRTRLIRRIDDGRTRSAKTFWFVIVCELVLLGMASGFAAGLGRTPAPESDSSALVTPVEALTGRSAPPPLNAVTMIIEWDFDLLWTLLCGAGILLYLAGVRRLILSRTKWPATRTICAMLGFLALFYLTNGSPAVYEEFSFGANLTARLLLCLIVPVLLRAARLGELTRAAVERRTDGTIGAWEVTDLLSRFTRLPFVRSAPAWALVVTGSFFAVYTTPLLDWTIQDPLGAQFTTIYFLAIGLLLARSVHTVTVHGGRVLFSASTGIVALGVAAVGLTVRLWPDLLGDGWYSLATPDTSLINQRASSTAVWIVAAVWVALTLTVRWVALRSTRRGKSTAVLRPSPSTSLNTGEKDDV